MSKGAKKTRKKAKKDICGECKSQADCCKFGAWADVEEAKKIASLGLRGEFFQLEKDTDFLSGYRIGTSYEDEPCTFLDCDGLCSIHKIDYNLKPKTCREFPYEKSRLSPYAKVLCTVVKSKKKKR
ncbi:MAG: YkgJ family cysteine cluster protein [Candidatus Omnitrophica bacterium]|nr:YkgJ family cysteine cluster protein [Candidatus Omnitrophota bacterium]